MADLDDSKLLRDFFLRSQNGGELSAFHGNTQYQDGNGLGDLFRGSARFIIPILTRISRDYLAEAGAKVNVGASLKEALKSGIKSAAQGGLTGIADMVLERRNATQSGGRRRGRRKKSRTGVYKGVPALKKANVAGLTSYNF